MATKVTVNDRKAFQKLMKEQRRIIKASTATVDELGKLGKNYARQYVPKYTRQTWDAITNFTRPQADGSTKGVVMVMKRQRTGDKYDTQQVAKFMAANKFGGRRTGFTSGNPKFMLNTRTYLNRIKKKIGNKNIKKGNSSTGVSV